MFDWQELLSEISSFFYFYEKSLHSLREIDRSILKGQRSLSNTGKMIVELAKELCDNKAEAEILIHKGKNLKRYSFTNISHEYGQDNSIIDKIAEESFKSGKAINIPDVNGAIHDLNKKFTPILGNEMVCQLAIPIVVEDENKQEDQNNKISIGVLNLQSPIPHFFNKQREAVISTLAGQAAIAFSFSSFSERKEFFEKIYKKLSNLHIPVHVIFDDVIDFLKREFDYSFGKVQFLFIEPGNKVRIVYSTIKSDIGITLDIDQCAVGTAIKCKCVKNYADVLNDPRVKELFKNFLGDVRSEIIVPVLNEANDVIGAMNIEDKSIDSFNYSFQYFLESFVSDISSLFYAIKIRLLVDDIFRGEEVNLAMISLGNQVANVLHMLNNYVGGIKTNINEINSYHGHLFEENPGLREIINDMLKSANNALELPKKLSLIMGEQKEIININDSIEAVLANYRKKYKDVRFIKKLDPEIPKINFFNFDLLIENLIQNAVNATERSKKPQILIETELAKFVDVIEKNIIIKVSDNGIGINNTDLPHIFDPSFSRRHGKGHGLGWGLWWVKLFVGRMAGRIDVESKKDVGSIFTITVPYTEGEQP